MSFSVFLSGSRLVGTQIWIQHFRSMRMRIRIQCKRKVLTFTVGKKIVPYFYCKKASSPQKRTPSTPKKKQPFTTIPITFFLFCGYGNFFASGSGCASNRPKLMRVEIQNNGSGFCFLFFLPLVIHLLFPI
jgi:hypothetical protein